jgi:D-alanyl-D-alanine carboxypeptidase/D-alanyl-D-alanine-endopeptidase (penicillin-binding protein 4)
MRYASYIVLLAIIFYGCAPSIRPPVRRDPLVQLRKEINSILSDSLFLPVHTGVKIVSLRSGQVLYDRESKFLMNPASNMKLLTSAAALSILDTGYQFSTVVYSDGYFSDSVLIGDLYIKGFGDPDLTTDDLNSISAVIRTSGVNRITGNVIADNSYFDNEYWGSGWMWDDDLDPDAPYISSLSVNGDCVSVSVGRTLQDSTIVSVIPELGPDFISVISDVGWSPDSVQNPLKLKRLTADRRNIILAKGELPRFGSPFSQRISLRYPHLYAAQLFRESLRRRNVAVDGGVAAGIAPPGIKIIASYARPIDKVINRMNKISDNLSAENILKIMGAATAGAPGTAKNGIFAIKKYLPTVGIDTTRISIADGSGVSRYNLLSADQLVRLLAGVYRQPRIFQMFYNSLPVAGVDGTLAGRMDNTAAASNLRAKTGTLNGVSCLSGYVQTRDAELLAFSVMMQNFLFSPEACRQAQDSIGILLANFSRNFSARKTDHPKPGI